MFHMTQERELTIREATEMLTGWRTNRDTLDGERDRFVRLAYAAGLGKSHIAQLTGLARQTVATILREPRP